MPMLKEFLNGGVVTSRDPSLLLPTETAQADDCILRPNTPALYKAPGRTSFGQVTAATKTKGLAHLAFDGNSDALIAYNGTKIRSAPYTSDAGTFADLITGLPNTGTETMDTVQYGGRHFVILGSSRIRRVTYSTPTDGTSPALTARTSGMVPVYGAGTSSAASGSAPTATTVAGNWPEPVGGAGIYWFLVTEVIAPSTIDEVESTYVGDPVYAEITDASTQSIQVYRRQDHSTTIFFNDGTDEKNTATHWRVYMSPRQPDTNTIPSLGTFQAVRTVPLAQASVTFSSASSETSTHCATANTTSPSGLTAFTNPSNARGAATTDNVFNNTYATASGPGTFGIVLRNFGFSSPTTVTGIKITVKMRCFSPLSPAQILLRLYKNNGASGSGVASKTFPLSPSQRSSADFTFVAGGLDDLWGTTWAAADFNDAAFAVELVASTAGAGSFSIDGVVVALLQGNSIVDQTGNYFPVVNVDTGVGIVTTFGANYPPPYASTADIFQGQLVTNDLAKPTALRYSLTDQPEYFPQPYVLSFESKYKDEVNFLRTVNNILVVGMTNGLKRVNWLPREQDAEFNGSRAWEDITTTHGILGPHCGTLFELNDSGPLLAYTSQNGLWVTDGMTTRLLNHDLDWTNLIDTSYQSQTVLKNYPKLRLLAMYYTPVGGTTNTKCIYFSYDPMHVKDGGRLPAVGPVSVSAASAAEAVLNGQPRLLTGHNTDGTVYVEDSGTTDASGGTIIPTIKTREMYLAGEGSEARVDRVYVHHQAFGANGSTAVCSATLTKHNIGEAPTTLETTTFNTDIRGISVTHSDNSAEAHTFSITKADLAAGMAIDYIGIAYTDLGSEEHYA